MKNQLNVAFALFPLSPSLSPKFINKTFHLPVGLNHFGTFVPVLDIADEVMKVPEPADCCFLFVLLLSFDEDSPSSDAVLPKLRPLKRENC